ncbi:hypothetical protein C8J57DRAFT_1232533 [Mycena rebaudengoi]|nr:hypothetical protein C8J57DRAFT_1232533 [Mycena rebaudengoi]
MSSGSRVEEILQEMRHRHRISDISRIKHHILFPARKYASLNLDDTLCDVGIRDLSVIHVRISVPGGSSNRDHHINTPPYSGLNSRRFSAETGNFPSTRPDVWETTADGQFQCIVCPGHKSIPARRIPEHEDSNRHQQNVNSKDTQSSGSSTQDRNVAGSSASHVPRDRVGGSLSRTLAQISRPRMQQHPFTDDDSGGVDWNSEMMDFNTQLQQPFDVQTTAQLGKNLQAYLEEEGDIEHDSDDDAEERSQASSSDSSGPEDAREKGEQLIPNGIQNGFPGLIGRHVPRCSFSKKQNAAIHWAMLALGLKDLPSDRVMDDIDKALQKMCGVHSIRYSGKLGHIYYVNDLAGLIAQEMANPTVCKNLHFFPEDTNPSLSQAWQASRWLNELDSELTTAMIRVHNQDFYINEPTLLNDGSVFMPIRWFKRDKTLVARGWRMCRASQTINGHGWIVEGLELKQQLHQWKKTDTKLGNRWRQLSRGHRVVAFPIWLYCDDTSGNTSKKWNKHNSFLFTAAGLPREYVHLESNIHFLATSNVAPPLEMLDGIVDQLEDCQSHGIWAWDSCNDELVLVIPSVLAMLGDNPMQSEFACHIGFRGNFFCRVCWVKGVPEDDEGEDEDENDLSGASSASGTEDTGQAQHQKKGKKKKSKKKKDETVSDMISHVTQFLSKDRSRSRQETIQELRSQFTEASVVGGKESFRRRKTESGIKDNFQAVFLERIFAVSTKKKRSKVQKQADVSAVLQTLPTDITSPVWRIKGFVKYFWRDAVARVKKTDKDILISRLSSFNVSGLGISPLSGHTLVNYSGSLTGRDFRTIVQAAPFVLHDLLDPEYIELWTALSAVVTLVWQPHIPDIDKYTVGHLKYILVFFSKSL